MQKPYCDESILVERSRRGDSEAFGQLVERHRQRAYQFALRLTRNPDEAADIVADVFVQAYKGLPNFRAQSAFSTWIYRITTNCFLDYQSKGRNTKCVSLESAVQTRWGEVVYQFEDPTPSAFDCVARRELLTEMADAIRSLPDYQRGILAMYHFERKSYEEIAEATKLPIGTVKSRLNRARLNVRRHYDSLNVGGGGESHHTREDSRSDHALKTRARSGFYLG